METKFVDPFVLFPTHMILHMYYFKVFSKIVFGNINTLYCEYTCLQNRDMFPPHTSQKFHFRPKNRPQILFSIQVLIQKHIFHKYSSRRIMDTRHVCKYCNYSTKHIGNYNKHCGTSKHKRKVKEVAKLKKNPPLDPLVWTPDGYKQRYTCVYCRKNYSRKDSLKRHQVNCSVRFSGEYNSTENTKKSTEKSQKMAEIAFDCENTENEFFDSIHSIQKNVKSKRKHKKHVRSVSKSVSKKGKNSTNVSTETGNNCPWCNKYYASRSGLYKHKKKCPYVSIDKIGLTDEQRKQLVNPSTCGGENSGSDGNSRSSDSSSIDDISSVTDSDSESYSNISREIKSKYNPKIMTGTVSHTQSNANFANQRQFQHILHNQSHIQYQSQPQLQPNMNFPNGQYQSTAQYQSQLPSMAQIPQIHQIDPSSILEEKYKIIISSKDELLDHYRKEIDYMRGMLDTAGGMANKAVGSLSHIVNNYDDAPPLEKAKSSDVLKIKNSRVKVKNKKEREMIIIKQIFSAYNHGTTGEYVGDIIVSMYKKKDPELQSIWATDTSRLTYLIKKPEDDEDSTNSHSRWVVDKKGVDTVEYIIDPILQKIKSLAREYLDQNPPGMKDGFGNIDNDRIASIEKTYVGLVSDIDDKKIHQKVLKYISSHFYFDKNKTVKKKSKKTKKSKHKEK